MYVLGMTNEAATTKPVTFHPSTDGRGKWHAPNAITGVPNCGARAILDRATAIGPLPAGTPATAIHPICCRRCLARASR